MASSGQSRIPQSLIDIHKPLPWDVFDANGLLLANKGTILSKVSSLIASGWGMPELYFASSKSSSEDIYNIAMRTYPLKMQSFIAGLAADDLGVIQDGIFSNMDAGTIEHVESIIAKISQLLSCYEATALWAYKAVRLSQSLYYLFKQNSALLQIILFVRRYFNSERYAASQAINRAFITFRCTEAINISTEESVSAVCAALTCDLAIHKKIDEFSKQKDVLNAEQRQVLEGHAERSYLMLKAAQVVDTSWLFWVRMHHKKLYVSDAKQTHLYKINDILQMADIISARASMRAGREPLPLFNAVANTVFDENKKLTDLGAIIIKALGVVPLGSIVDSALGTGILFAPDSIVLLTNDKFDIRTNFKVQLFEYASLSELKFKSPSCHKRLCGVLYIALNQLADRASYDLNYVSKPELVVT